MEPLTRREWLRKIVPTTLNVVVDGVGALEAEPAPTHVARLHTDRCIAYRGPECGACIGLCPPGAEGALRLVRWRPELDERRCTGCGRCSVDCPTSPSALEMLAL